jgi:outer membrane lipoprotein-sorting protein
MIGKIHMRFFVFLCLIAITAHNAIAKDAEIITKYLKTLDSIAMDFLQVDSRGANGEGKLIILKPHRFRCNYYAPYPLLLLGNKSEIVVYDYQLEQTTRIDAKENLFNFLLADTAEWNKNFRVENIIHDAGATLFKLYHHSTDRTISVVLNDKPLELKQIIIDEPDGNIIDIVISNVTSIQNVDNSLFTLPNPDVFGVPKRLDKNSIEKKYFKHPS